MLMRIDPPPSDCFGGMLIAAGEEPAPVVLLVGDAAGEVLPGRVIAAGSIVVRYAVSLLYEQDALFPQFALDDFRRAYHGAAALEFLHTRGDAFPRGDVVGIRVSTGDRAELFIKQLDLARPYRVYAFARAEDRRPLAAVDLAVWIDSAALAWGPLPEGDDRAPAFLRRGVPVYALGIERLPELADLARTVLSR
ncbi:MAG: hypothetical protein Kow00124_06040 [Anaerolineae bacterium]